MKSVITVTCPCCKGQLDIDVAREKVLSHRQKIDEDATPEEKAKLFDEVVDRVKKKQDESEALFESLKKEAAEHEKRLDDLFDDVKKKVAEEKDKPDDGEDPRKLFWD